MNLKKEKFKVSDMTCISCEKRIETEVRKLQGISNVIASNKEASVMVEYDQDICNSAVIKASIEKAGYTVGGGIQSLQLIGILFIGVAIYLLGNYQSSFDMNSKLQTGTTLAVLFVVGLFTSIHCVGMCGGIMLSQSIAVEGSGKWKALKPTLLYNAGRVVSYTVLGGIVGAIGSVLSISLQVKAGISIFAGVFMIVMGFNMAGFSLFKRFNLRMPWSFCSVKSKARTPFVVGLLNGLLPCGPLQTMQLYALGTGSLAMGALSMFVFSIGTVPLMLTFGLLTGFLSKGFTKSILKFSGILVLILGIVMANRGLALAGVKPLSLSSLMSISQPSTAGINAEAVDASSKAVISDGVQTLRMKANANGYTPNVLFVQKGVPVKWIITGTQITSCNNQIVIPSLNRQVNLKSGDNVIEFTPTSTDDITFSCWMGMINGVIKVVDDVKAFDAANANVTAPSSSSMSCCSGGGNAAPSKPSIYGTDISKVSTDRLVKKVNADSKGQSLTIKGIGYEFEPLIVLAKTSTNTLLRYDLKEFDTPQGSFELIDGKSGEQLKQFKAVGNIAELSYNFPKAGTFVVLKDGQTINVIEAVASLKKADPDKLRKQFIGQ